MKVTVLALVAILALPILSAFPQSGSGGGLDLLVSTEWLSNHLQDKDLIVLHAGWTRGDYKKGHIPGAQFLWIDGFTRGTPDLGTELPTYVQADSMLKNLGITDQSKIIIYFSGQNVTMTTRMILTFEYLGLADRVSLLDGGFEAWKREGRPVTKEIPNIAKGTYTPNLHPEVITNAEWIQTNLTSPNVTIIDARAAQFYEGKAGGIPRAGHIPGAVNIPFTTVMDSTAKILGHETLKQMFLKAGVKPGNQVVTYCHVGQQATLLYFVARYLGYNARLYDGSFEDWSGKEELPVENPSEKK